MSQATNIPSIEEIREDVSDLESGQERLEYLVELGDLLPEFSKDWCIEENRVLGCQSMVWLVPSVDQGRIFLKAYSDAPMVRGLVVILMAAYSGKTPENILRFSIQDLFDELKLRSFLSPMRSNGLHSMVMRVQEIATEEMGRNGSAETSRPEIRLPKSSPTRSLDSIRSDFPILERRTSSGKQLIYLDSAASSQRPQSVIDAISHVYLHHYSNAHRSGHELAAETTSAMEEARDTVRSFVGARDTQEILFTSGTTASINLVARAWGDAEVKEGDEILLSLMEHHSNIVPWQQLAQRVGAKIRWIPIRDDFQLDLDALPTLLSERTKLIAVTAVSNVLGTMVPIRKIADAAHSVGAKILVDAAQAVPHGDIDVEAMDADFVAFGGHKMLGPAGIGVLYGKKSILESMPPFCGGGGMIQTVTQEGFTSAGLPHRFEPGTPASPEAIGLKPAIEYLRSLGHDAILKHERKLLSIVEGHLRSLPGLRVLGPPIEERTGIFSFVIDGMHGDEIGRMLDVEGIAIRVGHHCAMPLHAHLGIAASCRASFYCYNTEEEAERFSEVVKKIHQRYYRRSD